MYACVIKHSSGRELYSSFHPDEKKAIEYGKKMMGVIRVEKAHSGEPPVWARKT